MPGGYLSGNLLIARGDTILAERSWGSANLDLAVPNGPQTRFAIASLAKPMTTIALLRLVERESIALSDSVERWIPDFPYGNQINIVDLVTHRARIPHRVTTPEEETVPMTAVDIVQRIVDDGLPGPPDGSRLYSSAGYAVIARIIELASGREFGVAMKELVFEPLGMHSTGHVDSRTVLPDRATGYLPGRDGLAPAPFKDLSFLAGGGSFWSTARDVHRFGVACLEGRLLTAASWEQFHALGWARGETVRWNGSNGGWFSVLDLYKDSGIVSVFLGNAAMGPIAPLRFAIPQLAAGETVEPATPAPPAAAVADSELSPLAGRYVDSTGNEVEVVIERGIVWLQDSALRPLGANRFFNPAFWVEVEFAVEGGVAKEARILIPGSPRTYTRSNSE